MDRDSAEYQARIECAADVGAFAAAIVGGLLIDNDYIVAGWIVLFVSVAVLFQRIRNLSQ